MVSADMCEHEWPGSGCPECRKADTEQAGAQAGGVTPRDMFASSCFNGEMTYREERALEAALAVQAAAFAETIASAEACALAAEARENGLRANMSDMAALAHKAASIAKRGALRPDPETGQLEPVALAAETALADRDVATDAVPVDADKLFTALRVAYKRGANWMRDNTKYGSACLEKAACDFADKMTGPGAPFAASPTPPAPAPEASDER